jgi:transposase
MTSEAPLDDLSDAQVVEAVELARQAKLDAERRAAHELHERGWTWEQIGKSLGVVQSTTHRWAREYREQRDLPE